MNALDLTKCHFFALGRNAMFAACQAFGLKRGDEILTPAFDCDGALQPFRVLGLELNFFRIHPYTFEVDIDDLKSKWSARIKMVHIINYFGFSQPWDEITKLKNEFKSPILEDNAYSLFSSYHSGSMAGSMGKPFGSFGDMAIFSLRKNLPLVDGGMLKMNSEKYKLESSLRKPKWFYHTEWRALLKLMKDKAGIRKKPLFLKSWAKDYFPPPPLYSDIKEGIPSCSSRDRVGKDFNIDYLRPMSLFSRRQFQRFTSEYFSEISSKRRTYYDWLSKRFSSIPFTKVIHPVLPSGIVPHCFSFLVDFKRDYYFEILRKKYDVMAWPTLSEEVIDQLNQFPEVELLGRKLLQINFPVTRILRKDFFEEIKKVCNEFELLKESAQE